MTQAEKERLIQAGIDVDEALARFMNNETLMTRFLKRFLDDKNYAALQAAVKDQNFEEMLAASHTLKGTSGNLSMKSLYALASQQVTLLRENNGQEAIALMPQIEATYNALREAILTLA